MTLFRGLFYFPGLSFVPHDSPLEEGARGDKLQLLSLSSPAEAEQSTSGPQQNAQRSKALVLVYNHLSPLDSRGRNYLRQRLWSGAVFSFEHPSTQHPWTQDFAPPMNPSSSHQHPWTQDFAPPMNPSSGSSSANPSAMKEPLMLFAKLRLFDGVLPPEKDDQAGISVYEENNQVAIGFRNMVERKLADQEALARAAD